MLRSSLVGSGFNLFSLIHWRMSVQFTANSSSNYTVFRLGGLPVKLSSFEVIFLWSHFPLWLSTCKLVFLGGFLPLRSSSCVVVFQRGHLPVMLSSCWVVIQDRTFWQRKTKLIYLIFQVTELFRSGGSGGGGWCGSFHNKAWFSHIKLELGLDWAWQY